ADRNSRQSLPQNFSPESAACCLRSASRSASPHSPAENQRSGESPLASVQLHAAQSSWRIKVFHANEHWLLLHHSKPPDFRERFVHGRIRRIMDHQNQRHTFPFMTLRLDHR